jgi:hypothetical protein
VPSKEDFANWVAPFGASLPSAYFEGSPESAILSRTNLFQMTLWEKISSKIQNPACCKQHVQVVSAKRSKIRQRHGCTIASASRLAMPDLQLHALLCNVAGFFFPI